MERGDKDLIDLIDLRDLRDLQEQEDDPGPVMETVKMMNQNVHPEEVKRVAKVDKEKMGKGPKEEKADKGQKDQIKTVLGLKGQTKAMLVNDQGQDLVLKGQTIE